MRKMSVAGQFYPFECSEIKRYIDVFSNSLPEQNKIKARALISPHAGYIYSGFTANSAYSMVDFSSIKRVVIIGPSHRIFLRGGSVALFESYESPCANLNIDIKYSQELIDRYEFLHFERLAHAEHSTETQVPFLQFYAPHVSVVEIVYGDIHFSSLVPMMKEILEDKENMLVISTDLSHFYNLKEANALDNICLKAIKEMNLVELEHGCEACGITGVKAALQASEELGLKSRLIDYRTSADASGDENRVVGYMSALLGV